METFLDMIEGIGKAPMWLPCIFFPVLLAAVALVMTFFGGKKLYWYLAAPIGLVGFCLVLCIDGLSSVRSGFVYLGLYAALAALLKLLFFIPSPVLGKRAGGKRSAREEKIYFKFREALEGQIAEDRFEESAPPAEEDGEQTFVTAEESGMRLSHVTELLAQLKKEELAPTDRLEADSLSRSVEAFGGKRLTEEEMCRLNDCLAAVLKLTAKYKL